MHRAKAPERRVQRYDTAAEFDARTSGEGPGGGAGVLYPRSCATCIAKQIHSISEDMKHKCYTIHVQKKIPLRFDFKLPRSFKKRNYSRRYQSSKHF